MFPNETRKRQEMLSGHIYALSEKILDGEKNEHLAIIQKMQMIYKDGFRHSYSDFFPVISKIFEKNTTYAVEYLMTNLEAIREILELDYSNGTNQFCDIYSQFTKLCDHLNLQISEMTYFLCTDDKLSSVSENMQEANKNLMSAHEDLEKALGELNPVREQLLKAQDNLLEANQRAKSLQTELIAVLSIFAAIVLTFSGGFTLLGSVMSSIGSARYYEMVVLVAVICGMVMFNTIFLMMYLVGKIINRNIYAKCKTEECTCEKKCNSCSRIRKRLPYVFYFNVLCVIGILVDCLVWLADIKGYM